jgi:hypothetical protein
MKMIFGAIGGMKIGRGNRSSRRKPTPAPLCAFGNVMTSASFQGFGKSDSRRQRLNKYVRCTSGRCLMHSFRILSSPQALRNFNTFVNLCMPRGLTFPVGVPSTDAGRAWTVVSTCRTWISSHSSWDVNWFSKQFAARWLSRPGDMFFLKVHE